MFQSIYYCISTLTDAGLEQLKSDPNKLSFVVILCCLLIHGYIFTFFIKTILISLKTNF